ncbi:MAG: hypothetical protein NT051_03650 [Candidatus Micrarchaeota archaeon]|nr:hypothetical protein [Candidatus Micrarchaeota archaeon]
MAHHCDRCRAEYTSGSFIDGRDYCMTCYIAIKQEKERKRREADEKARRETDARRKSMAQIYARDDSLKRQKELHEELRKRQMMDEIKSRKEDERRRMDELRARRAREDAAARLEQSRSLLASRKEEEILLRKNQNYSQALATSETLGSAPKQKKAAAKSQYYARGQEQNDSVGMSHTPLSGMGGGDGESITGANAITSLALFTAIGLPVSLSVGQKGVKARFVGKNGSAKSVETELAVTVFDSAKKKITPKTEPKKCRIEANGEQAFEVQFDLEEETAKGELTLEACLKETAFYIDTEAGRSETAVLHSQVKTAMNLAYKKGSAKIGGEDAPALSLEFSNLGETGGLISKKSCVKTVKGGKPASLALIKETKVKGLQKSVVLEFEAPENSRDLPEAIALALVGVDSNGKPYEKSGQIKTKQE